MRALLIQADALSALRMMPDGLVHTCITSPPYYNQRDYGIEGQMGLERTPREYVQGMVEVFREVRRVLRDDGTLWLNLGDCYATPSGMSPQTNLKALADRMDPRANPRLHNRDSDGLISRQKKTAVPEGFKNKDLMGMPWRVAFGLQEDGWYLRKDNVWQKPNPMPESVTDRTTTSHEYFFHLSKSESYFYDNEAIKEPASGTAHPRGKGTHPKSRMDYSRNRPKQNASFSASVAGIVSKRNKRSVWTVHTKAYPGAHYATFPHELIEPCVLAGTSAAGACVNCAAPWPRIIKEREWDMEGNEIQAYTVGWQPSCACGFPDTKPGLILDPFSGTAVTGEVALMNDRHYLGIEINPESVRQSQERFDAAGLPLAILTGLDAIPGAVENLR